MIDPHFEIPVVLSITAAVFFKFLSLSVFQDLEIEISYLKNPLTFVQQVALICFYPIDLKLKGAILFIIDHEADTSNVGCIELESSTG